MLWNGVNIGKLERIIKGDVVRVKL